METIITLANALAKAGKCRIDRMDIQYNVIDELYSGRVWLSAKNFHRVYDVCENGEIDIIQGV